MAFASSSSSAGMALRSVSRSGRRCISSLNLISRQPVACRDSQVSSRSYSVDQIPGRPAPHDETSFPPSSAASTLSPRPIPTASSINYRGSSTLTPQSAQKYLSTLLDLPPTQQIPPKLALQILTHKSYRFVSLPRNPYLSPAPLPAEQENNWAAAHNSRLSFMGRRAIKTYLAMFVHSAVASSGVGVREMAFLRGKTLEKKMEDMTHVKNLGRSVGGVWGIGKVTRSDENPNGGEYTVNGMAVEAVIGAIYTQFGSPAAHRAFHLHLLPHIATQLRDPILIERVESMRKDLETDLGGGILVQ